MPIKPERIEEFRKLYREAYGKEITVAEAEEMASRLLSLYKLLMRPLPDDGKQPPTSAERTSLKH